MLKVILGDLIEMMLNREVQYVGQGCNCYCKMGSGFAKLISDNFPAAVDADNNTIPGLSTKLGTFSHAFIHCNSMHIFNMYTQFYYGKASARHFDLEAYRRALVAVLNNIPNGATLFIPAIGAGLGGGDIHEIIGLTNEIATTLNRCVTMVITPNSPYAYLINDL